MRITTDEALRLRADHLGATYAVGRAQELIEANRPGMSARELLSLLRGDVAEAVAALEDAGMEPLA